MYSKSMWLTFSAVLLFGLGLAVGWALPSGDFMAELIRGAADDHHDDEEGEPHEDHEDVVVLSKEAEKNLGLKVGRIEPSDFTRKIRLPASVIENPSRSRRSISTNVTGIITNIHVAPGQVVQPNEPLLDLQLTGEALATTQSELLDTIRQLEVLDIEYRRVEALAQSGGVAGKRKLELEYERKRLDARRGVYTQELLVHGLNHRQIDHIITSGNLIRELTIYVPSRLSGIGAPREAAQSLKNATIEFARHDSIETDSGSGFTIESLEVFPGKSVKPGDDLCHLSDHEQLLIRGEAFENDVESLAKMNSRGDTASIEFGIEGHHTHRDGFRLLYIQNHVDLDSQTFHFYLPLKNEVLNESRDADGVLYRSWRFKPGQRVHVVVPVETWTERIVLPLEAVVQEGPEAFVFRQHIHEHEEEEEHEHEFEYEPVPVHIEYQDKHNVVIEYEPDGELKLQDIVALNSAYRLQLALKADAGGGGHHHHDH